MLVGVVNRVFATQLRLNPLIVTLGVMSIVSGSALILTGGLTKPLMTPGFNSIGQGLLFVSAVLTAPSSITCEVAIPISDLGSAREYV